MDPVAITIATYDRLAAQRLGAELAPLDMGQDMARVESFLLRTGRPLPRVIVTGADLALRCRQVDHAGGQALGLDAAPAAIEMARRHYAQGEYLEGDVRDLPVPRDTYDGAWTESVFSHFPRAELAGALASVHGALRPGGLLYVRLPLGDSESDDGGIYRVRYDAAQFEHALSALDFTLLETQPLPNDEAGLVFRREY
jgi:SAM-dependent methyltransferase